VRRLTTIIAWLALTAGLAAAAEVTPLLPDDEAETALVGTGGDGKDYLVIGPEGVALRVTGPGVLSGWVRGHLPGAEPAERTVTVTAKGVPGLGPELVYAFSPSGKWVYEDGRAGAPSGGVRFDPVQVPAGRHTLKLTPKGGTLLARLTWEAEDVSALAARTGVEAEPVNPWSTSVTVGLETIYDDNFLRYSDPFQDELLSGQYPHRFQADRIDSHIIAPSLDVYAQRKLTDWGNTRFSFGVKSWRYVQGGIKNNTSFDYQVRQFFKGGRSLEIGYNYAPQQYIRELSELPPGSGAEDAKIYQEFRYTRNVFNLVWRQKVTGSVNGRLEIFRSLRYYNQPFMENDIKDLGFRLTAYWRPFPEWFVTADYGYTDAPARGYDEAGETRETSDNSDPSFNEDMAQLDVGWRPDWAAAVLDEISVRVRYEVSWFTSQKSLEDDPYHVGRIDRVWQFQLAWDKELPNGVDMQVGWKYARRRVESPWDGDIHEDKDFDQRRYWIGLTYKL